MTINNALKEKGNIKNITIHMVGNSHIDPVWLWGWQEGCQVVRSTFRNILNLMKKFPEFIFTSSSAVFYEWVESIEPEMFEEIKRMVKAGRWVIVGGWWVEPDCNIPCGESFIRQALYGQRYFKEKFGLMAEVGYNIDSFGHNAMLPQILAKCRLKSYVFMRPNAYENKEVPGEVFWWESPDGSRVLCYRIPFSYETKGNIVNRIEKFMEIIKPPLEDYMCFYGKGDHGGGPTEEDIIGIIEADGRVDLPKIIFSSPNIFFKRIIEKNVQLPVFHGELQHHASGCYSAHSEVKRNNRVAENLLLTAEKAAVLTYILFKRSYPQESLTKAWKKLLFSQFHDILAGTSIVEAYEDVRNMHGEALSEGSIILNNAIQTLASKIDTRGPGTPIIVFNPHSWSIRFPIEVEGVNGEGGLVDFYGRTIPMQRIKSSANVGDWRQRIVFIAEVPALGYRVYYNTSGKGVHSSRNEMRYSENSLENKWFRLEVNPSTGYISRLYDKMNGVEVFNGDACVPIVIEDLSDTWSHGVTVFDKVIGTFKDAEVSLEEFGDVRATLRIENRYNDSLMRIYISLYRELPYIKVKASLNWQEQHKMLKLCFPVGVKEPTATHSIPYGHIVRPCNGEEEPIQSWVDVTGRAKNVNGGEIVYGLSICNDCKYSCSVIGSEVRLTVLRSPPYAHHDPYRLEPNIRYRYMDQGWQSFNLILLPHAGTWREAQTVKVASLLNVKPIALVEDNHEGSLPAIGSFIEVSHDNIVVSAIKKHEDSENIILRCYESYGAETTAEINFMLLGKRWTATFKPHEIKTFLVPVGEGDVKEVDMLELIGDVGSNPPPTHRSAVS
ncbi:MAG: glycoside hydrolase family 38 C-terminal domain-containing protein [Candidatus Bathyarchaeia archaeon]